ncbi:LacI family DNA-binding transcriptional regulator [Microbacterium ureisolvens]|uniref:LacI family DNA-binding transcriptional regulator n=1 Tax=Microbacterium ureisolvens TaxID=2781186 RepID=A0ABS7HWK4_9MICO|nr:LacI family DNA-binding transcriptional regulator [Microbacterium ureisolvens]MBW9109480.1 LacI family DNA-binding transcriptional regulator [Microbacterium ureisolvens]
MATLHDVARAAGVSPMTVSNVLNKHPHVRAETRERVLKAIDELGYRVNVAARNLRAGRTDTIGFAVPEVDSPYFGQLASRIIAKAHDAGYRVAIERTGADRENELSAITSSRTRMYDGLILSAVGLGTADRELLNTDVPMVVLGESMADAPVDHIALPNEAGTYAATAHLVDRGCRRIAIVQGEDQSRLSVTSLRHAGYRRALADRGIEADDALVIGRRHLSIEDGRSAAHELVDGGAAFDGVVCITDTVALGVLRGLADRGLSVPGDVRVVGFDDILEARYSVPSLTTIDPDRDEVARLAVDLLLTRIAGSPGWQPHDHVTGFRLVERESTA